MIHNKRKNKKGVEMMEVIISVAVLGILSIVVFTLLSDKTKATATDAINTNDKKINDQMTKLSGKVSIHTLPSGMTFIG